MGSLARRALCHSQAKALEVSRDIALLSPKGSRAEDQMWTAEARRSQVDLAFGRPHWCSERKLPFSRNVRSCLVVSFAFEMNKMVSMG